MTKLRISLAVLLLAAAAPAQTVRIGVFGLFHPRTLVVTPAGPGLILEIAGHSIFLENRSAQVRLSGGSMAVIAGTSSWRVQRFSVHARDGGAVLFTLAVPGKLHRQYRGILEIARHAGELLPVVTMDQETAVASVVAAESSPGAPLEALKAQAVAARSFLAARASGHVDFDFCDTTHCQFLRQPPPADAPAAQATRATRGLVLTWHDAVFAAMYTPACGGRTRSLAELDLPVRDYPYFSVDCPYCRAHPHEWTRDLPRPVNGERQRLQFVRQHGWSALPGNNYRLRDQDGVWLAQGSGLGHGLGLCARGAAAQAQEGKSFREILDHYYPNAVLTTAH